MGVDSGSQLQARKPEGQSLPGGAGCAWNGAWPAGGMLPNAEEPGLLPKASKLAKPPWEGVWPIGGENIKVMFIYDVYVIHITRTSSEGQGLLNGTSAFLQGPLQRELAGAWGREPEHAGERAPQRPPSSLPTFYPYSVRH